MGEAGKWAACDLGATKPEENGFGFIFGSPKIYEFEYGKYIDYEEVPYFDGFKYFRPDLPTPDKYASYSKYNDEDNLTELESKDDPATVLMGSNWKTPTEEDWKKLISLCNLKNDKDTFILTLKTDTNKQLKFYNQFWHSGQNAWFNIATYLSSTPKQSNLEARTANEDSVLARGTVTNLGGAAAFTWDNGDSQNDLWGSVGSINRNNLVIVRAILKES